MLSIDQLVLKFLSEEGFKKRGNKEIAKRYKTPLATVAQARESYRNQFKANNDATQGTYLANLEDIVSKQYDKDNGTIQLTTTTSFEPKSDEELAVEHKIDLTKYRITNYWTKKLPNGKFTSSLFCKLINVDTDLGKQKDIYLQELKDYSPTFEFIKEFKVKENKNKLLELNLCDMHFGKMSHKDETGEDYDLKIAEERFRSAIQYLLSKAPLDEISDILFPIGNDLINVDNLVSTTTMGTPQDCDSRFHKIIQVVKRVLIDTISGLSAFATVHIPIVPGNHDEQTSYMLGEILESYFHNNPNVHINNSPSPRKYFQFGECAFMYTHGNKENHKELGNIFSAENPHLWGDTKFRYIRLGHFHKNKKIEVLARDTYQGFEIEILPSLSATDAWHSGKGYIGSKKTKSYLYNKHSGEVANYTYTVPQ